MSLLLSHLKVPALLDSKIASSHKTALHLSAKKGFSECVRILISSGAYPDAIDQFKMMVFTKDPSILFCFQDLKLRKKSLL